MAIFTPFPPSGGSGGGDYDDAPLKARVGATETTNRSQDVTLDDHGRRILTLEETPPLDLAPLTDRVAVLETAGVEGPAGADGAPGRDGVDGLPGRDGTDGNDGQAGPQGLPGRDGVDGAPGRDGLDGAAGRDGADGLPGEQGIPGVAGADGQPGERGPVGPAGSDAPAYDDSDLTRRMGEVESDFASIETAFESEIDTRAEGDRVLGVRVKALEDGGVVGPAGPEGPVGPTGADGVDGADGAVGPQGPIGPAGADGVDGSPGVAGERGPVGADGVDGSPGADGAVGPEGPIGPAGRDGLDGQDGAIGPEGPVGSAGRDGVDGKDGVDGLPGADGLQGPVGPAGQDGANGTNGADGRDGADGLPGADGAAGPQGPVGPAGQDGADGVDGAPGVQGPQGVPGADGDIGSEGPAGRDGVDGVDGQNGADGVAGPQGPAGPVGPEGPAGPQGPAGDGSGDSSAAVTESRPWIVYLPVSDANATAITLQTAGIVSGDQLVVRGDLPGGPIDETLTVSEEVLDEPLYDWLSNLQAVGFSPLVLQSDVVEIDGVVYISPRLGIAISLGATAPSEAFRVVFTGKVAEALSRGGETVATFATFAAGRTTDVYDPVGQRDLAETLGVLRADIGEVLPIGGGNVIRTGLTQRVHVLEQAGGTVGPAGPAGPQGPEGPQGAQGQQGVQGQRGLPGADGAQGIKGDTGSKGDQGLKGDTGAKGDQGVQGLKGDTGAKGDTGPAGSGTKFLGKARRKVSETNVLLSDILPAGTKEFEVVYAGGGASGVAVYQDDGTTYAHGGHPGLVRKSGRITLVAGMTITTVIGAGGAKASSTTSSGVPSQNAGSGTTVTIKLADGTVVFTDTAPGGPTWLSRVIDRSYMNTLAAHAAIRPQFEEPGPAKPGLSVPAAATNGRVLMSGQPVLDGPGAGAGARRVNSGGTTVTEYAGNGSDVRYTNRPEFPRSVLVQGGQGGNSNAGSNTAGQNPYPNEAGSWGSGGAGGFQLQNFAVQPGTDGADPSAGGGGCAVGPPNSGSPAAGAAVSGAGGAGVADLNAYG